MSKIKVSISCITYNHEPYIIECIEGFLLQKTNFAYEILIHDDASKDKTASIIREYEAKYPDIIKPIYQSENQYSKHGGGMNIKYNFPRARGKFIAMCEGDDYWTDPYKLQKQVDFLEANKDYVLSHTNGQRRVQNRIEPWDEWPINGDVQDFFYNSCLVRTCSALFKKEFIEEYNQVYNNCKSKVVGEWPIFAFYSTKGKFHYLADTCVVNRNNPNSVTSRTNLVYYYNYAFDILEVKRFLRDYIFKGKLDEIYPENELAKTENYLGLRKAFDYCDYKTAKELSKFKIKNKKAANLSKFTSNRILFVIGCLLKKIRESISNLIKKRK